MPLPPDTLATIRFALLAILVVGMAGTAIELLLLPHTEGFWQLLPVLLLAAGLAAVSWHLFARSPVSTRALQLLMLGFVVSGVAGLLFHLRGNFAFELELHPGTSGFGLFWEALKGATPTLAPGTMIQLGLVGLAYTYRHPALSRAVGAVTISREP